MQINLRLASALWERSCRLLTRDLKHYRMVQRIAFAALESYQKTAGAVSNGLRYLYILPHPPTQVDRVLKSTPPIPASSKKEVAPPEVRSPILEEILRLLEDPEEGVRKAAFNRLYRFTHLVYEVDSLDYAGIITGLLAATRDSSYLIRGEAVGMLGMMKISHAKTLLSVKQALLNACVDPFSYVRQMAVWALGQLKIEDPDVIDTLTILLEDLRFTIQMKAAWALSRLGCGGPRVTEILLNELERDMELHRRLSIEALKSLKGSLGSAEVEVIQKLKHVSLNDPVPVLRWAAQEALHHLGHRRGLFNQLTTVFR